MLRRFVVLGSLFLLAACETLQSGPPPPPPPPAFASIQGLAQYYALDGRLYSCAGFSVALIAESPKVRARMVALYGSSEHAIASTQAIRARSAGAPQADEPADSAQCGRGGEFVFHNVLPGVYFMIAHVRAASTGKASDDQVILQKIAVEADQARRVRLTP